MKNSEIKTLQWTDVERDGGVASLVGRGVGQARVPAPMIGCVRHEELVEGVEAARDARR